MRYTVFIVIAWFVITIIYVGGVLPPDPFTGVIAVGLGLAIAVLGFLGSAASRAVFLACAIVAVTGLVLYAIYVSGHAIALQVIYGVYSFVSGTQYVRLAK
jgi:hypothetical protein